MEVSGQLNAPGAIPPGKNRSTHWIGDFVGPRAGLGVVEKGKLAPAGIRTPSRPARSLIPTTLSRAYLELESRA